MKPERIHKINLLIQEDLGSAINRVLSEKFGIISVNCVNTAKDLSKARVFVSSIKNKNKILETIEKHKHRINEEFVKSISLKRIPRLHFILDEKQEDINRVEKLLHKLKSKKK